MAQQVSPWAQIDGQPNTLPVPSASPVWAPLPPDPHSGPVMPPAPVPRVNLAPQPDPSNPFATMPAYQAPRVNLTSDPIARGVGSNTPKPAPVSLPSDASSVWAQIPPSATPQVRLTDSPLERIDGNLQNRLEADLRKDANPRGTPENHPGKLGKLEHVFSEIGNVAGDIAIPRVMANIPNTQLHRSLEEQGYRSGIEGVNAEESQNQEQAARAAYLEQETAASQAAQQKAANAGTILYDANRNPIGYQDGSGKSYGPHDPNLPPEIKDILSTTQPKLPSSAFELWLHQNPNGTPQQYQDMLAKPLTQADADARNAVWDKIAAQYHLPAGQFKAGMSSADATSLAGALNNVIARSQGAQGITIKSEAADSAGNARSDRNYQYNSTQLNKLSTPIEQVMQRFGNLESDVAQGTPQADALVAPQLLTVMAGGQGSGLRMNESEISRIVGGRSAWENLRASIQHWSTDPNTANSITPDQRQQIHALMDAVKAKLTAKEQIINQANEQLLDTDDVQQQRRIVADARRQLDGIDSGGGQDVKPGYIGVQIPGHPPGQIPEDKKDEFLKNNPGAKVL